jgi:hypothetical protein
VRQVELGSVRLKDLDEPEKVVQLEIEGLPTSFPPLRADADEPMDFGERLARKIHADVERKIEMALAGSTTDVAVKGTAGLALLGLVPLVLVVAAIVAIVLLLRLVL